MFKQPDFKAIVSSPVIRYVWYHGYVSVAQSFWSAVSIYKLVFSLGVFADLASGLHKPIGLASQFRWIFELELVILKRVVYELGYVPVPRTSLTVPRRTTCDHVVGMGGTDRKGAVIISSGWTTPLLPSS